MPDLRNFDGAVIDDSVIPFTGAHTNYVETPLNVDNAITGTQSSILSVDMAMNQPPTYAGMPKEHNHVGLYNKLPSVVGGPQMNSTFAHSSARVFGQSQHVPMSSVYTSTYGGNAFQNAQLPRVTSLANGDGCSAAAQYNPFSPARNYFGQPHGGFAPINDSTWRQVQNSSDVSLNPSHIASRQAISKDLPPFSGRPEEWPLFITNYEQSTERCGFSEQENLIRLQKSLRGAALEAVRGKLMMPSTVHLAIETLRMLFGRPDVIHNTLQRKLRQMPAVRTDRLNTLIDLALGVQKYRATISTILCLSMSC
ncbi:uncharacterized protein LOC126765555 [Bactrocera neohumeralis]|uniref:uncharacterized protein LOC126765555 n=1 Tax=Bactrocera neohumeralis TaxID=98809 RepID=UPI002165E6CA|nr:uncharacterized protein LOC126765555 [Bactrocera neohumeralis]